MAGDEENRRKTDTVLFKMADDLGYMRGKVETIVADNIEQKKINKSVDSRVGDIESTRKTARGVLIGATILAGTTGSAVHAGLAAALTHLKDILP